MTGDLNEGDVMSSDLGIRISATAPHSNELLNMNGYTSCRWSYEWWVRPKFQ